MSTTTTTLASTTAGTTASTTLDARHDSDFVRYLQSLVQAQAAVAEEAEGACNADVIARINANDLRALQRKWHGFRIPSHALLFAVHAKAVDCIHEHPGFAAISASLDV